MEACGHAQTGLFSFSLNVLVPSGTALLSQAAALYLRFESFQGWFAFHNGSVKHILLLPSQTRLSCAAVQTL